MRHDKRTISRQSSDYPQLQDEKLEERSLKRGKRIFINSETLSISGIHSSKSRVVPFSCGDTSVMSLAPSDWLKKRSVFPFS